MNPNNSSPDLDLSSQIYPNRQNIPTPPPVPPTILPATPIEVPTIVNTPNIPPRAFMSNLPPNQGKKGKGWLLSILVIVILVIGGIAAYAYFEKIGPFANPPYKTTAMASSIFAGIGNIRMASYSLHMNVVSETRAADAKPFQLAVDDSEQALAYKKDLDTVRDLQSIFRSLMNYYDLKKSYPSSIPKDANISTTRLSLYQYYASSDLSDYSLTVTFQSLAAVSAVKKNIDMYSPGASKAKLASTGKTITFNKNIYSYYVSIPAEPPQPFFANLTGMQQYLGYIPGDFELDGTLSGATAKTADNKYDSQARISGSANYSDISAAVDTQFKKVGDNIYVLVSKFPAIIGSISKVKDKWIVLTPQDMAAYGSSYLGSSAGTPQDQIAATKEKTIQGIKTFLTVADENQALVVTNKPTIETVNGMRAYRYELEFNKETMPKFYSDLTSRLSSQFTEKNPMVFDQNTMDYLGSPQFSQAFDYFRKNTTLTLWANGAGIPVQVMYKIRMVPNADAKNSDRQIILTTTLSLNDINKVVNIETPKDSMSLKDATIAVTGQSKELYEFNKQQSSISTIRSMLDTYKSNVGMYPVSLDELIKTVTGPKGTYTPRITTLPVDTYTEQSFDYTKSGDDYTLKYTLNLPPYVRGTMPVRIYSYNYAVTAATKQSLSLTAVDGSNTADSKIVSREAVSQSKIDTDKDGLPDALEKYLGTNLNKKDTDGDGYDDYTELNTNTDPLGPGNLKTTSSY